MPSVTVLDSVPSGLPTATATSPTARASLSPMTAGGQARSINFQHRDVGGGILTDDGGVVALVAAVQLHLYAGRAVDDVGAGQDVASWLMMTPEPAPLWT